jgi:hypothetical protein
VRDDAGERAIAETVITRLAERRQKASTAVRARQGSHPQLGAFGSDAVLFMFLDGEIVEF